MCSFWAIFLSDICRVIFDDSVVWSSICSNIGFSHPLHYIAVTPRALKTELVLSLGKVITYMCKNIYVISMLISQASLFFFNPFYASVHSACMVKTLNYVLDELHTLKL